MDFPRELLCSTVTEEMSLPELNGSVFFFALVFSEFPLNERFRLLLCPIGFILVFKFYITRTEFI